MKAYRKDFGKTKYIYFLIKDDVLWKKYDDVWTKVSNSIKNKFNSEPVYNEKYLKTKMKLQKKILSIFVSQ